MMTRRDEAGVRGGAEAATKLAALRAQVEWARAELEDLRAQSASVQSELAQTSATSAGSLELREANQALLLGLLKSRSDAAAAALALEHASQHARTDSLTGLPDRAELLAKTDAAIASAAGRTVALLFVNIDSFKRINDAFGHAVGDRVLKVATSALLGCAPPTALVSRHGGDEFVVLLPDLAHYDGTWETSRCVLDALGSPHAVDDYVFRLSACVGVACYPDHGENAAALLAHAALDMLRGKREARSLAARREPGYVRAKPPSADLRALAEQEQRYALLREANEHLVASSLGALELNKSAERAHNRQSEFLAVLAHELRSPLAPIRTAAELMGRLRNPDEKTIARFQEVIERQVTHMARLVSDLAEFSKANFGKLRIQMTNADLVAITEQAMDASRPAMIVRKQHFHVQQPKSPLMVHGDAARLVQVLINLLDNASKYTPDEGDIWLNVGLVDGVACVSVTDNGIGISQAALPDIFEPFVQDAHAVGFNAGGMGIGLTVVRELVQAHGGSIHATSAGAGAGSRFEVTLPIVVWDPVGLRRD